MRVQSPFKPTYIRTHQTYELINSENQRSMLTRFRGKKEKIVFITSPRKGKRN